MDAWVVVFDGYLLAYGCHYSLLGVYDSEKKADEAMEEFKKSTGLSDDYIFINHVELNKTLKVNHNKEPYDEYYETKVCYGGYIE